MGGRKRGKNGRRELFHPGEGIITNDEDDDDDEDGDVVVMMKIGRGRQDGKRLKLSITHPSLLS